MHSERVHSELVHSELVHSESVPREALAGARPVLSAGLAPRVPADQGQPRARRQAEQVGWPDAGERQDEGHLRLAQQWELGWEPATRLPQARCGPAEVAPSGPGAAQAPTGAQAGVAHSWPARDGTARDGTARDEVAPDGVARSWVPLP